MLYSLTLRHSLNWKVKPCFIYIGNHSLDHFGFLIDNECNALFPDEGETIQGLAYICAYTMIPYGKDGRQYVAEKIYPKTLEEFMKEKAIEILNTVGINDKEKDCELYAAVEEYCRIYTQNIVPYNFIGFALLLTHLSSEETKEPLRVISEYYSRAEKEKERDRRSAYNAYTDHCFDVFKDIDKTAPKELNLEELLSQILIKLPFGHDFEFTDEHRQVIDSLPLFTGFAK